MKILNLKLIIMVFGGGMIFALTDEQKRNMTSEEIRACESKDRNMAIATGTAATGMALGAAACVAPVYVGAAIVAAPFAAVGLVAATIGAVTSPAQNECAVQ